MTKGAKITIGLITTLAIAGVITYIVITNKPKSDSDASWEESDEASKSSGSSTGTKPAEITPEQRKINNFNSVKSYFGSSAATYLDRVVVTKTTAQLAQTINQPASVFGIGESKVSIVYWKTGVFTVKIAGVKAAVKGYYHKGGTVIRITSGKGKFALKAGLREEDSNRIRAIARAILR